MTTHERRTGVACEERERGSALVMAFIFLLTMSMVLYAMISATRTQMASAKFQVDFGADKHLTLGALRFAAHEVTEKIANFEDVNNTTGTVVMQNPGATYGASSNPTVSVNFGYTRLADPPTVTDPDGFVTSVELYQIDAWLDQGSFAGRRAHMIIRVNRAPIFQYAVFYNHTFEFFPGPNMTISGRVHSNGDSHIGAGSGLTFDTTSVRTVGNLYRTRLNNGAAGGDNVSVMVNGSSVGWDDSFDSTSSNWQNDVLTTFDDIVQDAAHGVQSVAAPDIDTIGWDSTTPLSGVTNSGTTGNYYYDEAREGGNGGLIILDSGGSDGADLDGDGNGDGFKVMLDGVDRTQEFYDAGIIARDTMFDGREEKTIGLLEIDLGKMKGTGYDYWPSSGLIYAARTDATPSSFNPGASGQPNGVRFKNGTEIGGDRPSSYTPVIVSGNPVYVQGDFNTVKGYAGAAPSGATAPRPAVVITDSINLLSNAWDNSKTNGQLPNASNTTFNMGFITGNVPTQGSSYSGGLENLPRFHERWSGKTATLNGSFISLFESGVDPTIGNGKWVYGSDNYTAPNRDWGFDPVFLGANSPYFPQATSLGTSVVWFE